MSKIPTLNQIVGRVENIGLAKRKRALQGRKPLYSDGYIIALAIYQKLAGFKYAQQMLEVLASLGKDVPAASTFAERKALLVMHILAVKQLCSSQPPPNNIWIQKSSRLLTSPGQTEAS